MKFQHLILPLLLWGVVVAGAIQLPPSNSFVVGGGIIVITLAAYFTLHLFSRGKIPLIAAGCVFLFLFSSALTGFSFINLILILAIGTLFSQLTS